MTQLFAAHSFRIPFATTDYDEENSAFVAQKVVAVGADAFIAAAAHEGRCVVVPRTYPITPNPFHMPGQSENLSVRLPALSNGFILAIFRAEEGGA